MAPTTLETRDTLSILAKSVHIPDQAEVIPYFLGNFGVFRYNTGRIMSVLTVALTGGIASGKSVVADVLEQLGCYVHRADKVAHELMEPEKPAWQKIVGHFGRGILNKDKTINRARLGAIVFADKKERLFLNNILHPLVMAKKQEVISRLEEEGRYKIYVSEAALTIEAGYSHYYDKVVVVYCEREEQIRRLIRRDGISREEAVKKFKAQMPPEEKLKFADYVIDTSGSIQQTIEQTEKVYRSLMQDYELMEVNSKK